MRTVIQGFLSWTLPGYRFDECNDVIRRACNNNNCYAADLYASDTRYETFDGMYPTVHGHDTIASGWIMWLEKLGLLDD